MLRRSLTGSMSATSSPSMWTRPAVGSTIRLTIRIKVVLPEPEEPTSTTDSWEAISVLKSSTATVPPGYSLRMFSNPITGRSEEHTSELQSRGHLVCRLLLEKKKHERNET